MACPSKLFINSDHNIKFGKLTGFTFNDISDLTVTLRNGSETIVKKFSSGQIKIIGDVMFMMIAEADITVAGIYTMEVMLLDKLNDTIRLTPCPETLRIYE